MIYLHVLMQLIVSSGPDWTDCDRHEALQGHILQPSLFLVAYIPMSKQHLSTSRVQRYKQEYIVQLVAIKGEIEISIPSI